MKYSTAFLATAAALASSASAFTIKFYNNCPYSQYYRTDESYVFELLIPFIV